MEAMAKEPTGCPIVAASVELLQAIVDKTN